jgi:CheY-like chemotaxis protein
MAGFDAAARHHPVLSFIDIGMPEMNGYDLAVRLRAFAPTRSSILVAVTGWGQDSDRELSKKAGFDEHIVKPLEFETLQELLGRLHVRSS